MNRIALLAIAAVTVATASSVYAADMPSRARPAPAPVAVAGPWTGCYVGGNVGGGWSRLRFVDPTGPTAFGGHTADGVVGGGQAGCDYQIGNFVIGAQGMFDWSGIKGGAVTPAAGATSKIPWFGDVTGRVGITLAPNALAYAKGGWGWVHDSLATTTGVGGTVTGTAGSTLGGWIAGGGVEWMFSPGWSVFAEYNYISLGTNRLAYNAALVPGATFPIDVTQTAQAVLIGLNVRFGSGALLGWR